MRTRPSTTVRDDRPPDGRPAGSASRRPHLAPWLRRPGWTARYWIKRAALSAAEAFGRRPAFTCGTYRTNSTSVHHAIRAAVGPASAKAHALAAEHHRVILDRRRPPPLASTGVPFSGHVGDFAIRDQVIRRGADADFVILLRDPIEVARSLAGTFRKYWPEGFRERLSRPGFAESTEAESALHQVMFGAGTFPRNLMIDWMRHDPLKGLGWDPLAHPFDHERGWSEHAHGPWRVLVLRVDLGAAESSRIIGDFLRARGVAIARGNSGRHYGLYGAVSRVIASHPEWVESIYADPVVLHHWSPAAIESMRSRWLGGDST